MMIGESDICERGVSGENRAYVTLYDHVTANEERIKVVFYSLYNLYFQLP
jgi:hypothetical protein